MAEMPVEKKPKKPVEQEPETEGEKPAEKMPEMCPGSLMQTCRRKCPEVSCAKNKCLMRNDNCCDLTCERKEEKPIKEEKPVKKEKPTTCKWESSVCDPEKRKNRCGEGYFCDPKACVPSQCNCELIDGKPSFICTADCYPGCVKDDKAALCNEDRHCGFLGLCSEGHCTLKTDITFEDVQIDCASVNGDEYCQASGCGRRADRKGRCMPESADEISCKTIGANWGLCYLLKCEFDKRGMCTGKSTLE